MTTLTNLELAMLGLISEKPKHGYQIELDIQARGMREWAEIGFSSIYHALNKLEQKGWLSAALDSSGQGPARKVFSLSAAGRQALHDAVLTRMTSPRRYSSDLELALAYSDNLSSAELKRSLEDYSNQLQNKIKALNEKLAQDQLRGIPESAEWLFDHSLHALNCELSWIQDLISKLIRNEHA